MLPELREPDWRSLMLAESNEFSDAQRRRASRLDVALRKDRPGDILVLADETPGRAHSRFPPGHIAPAAAAIERALDALAAGADDDALVQGASGGDLLFAEACVARGVRVQLLLPLSEPEFIEQSVANSIGGEDWRTRYFALGAQLKDAPRVMPDEGGPLPARTHAFERCNVWLLHSALARSVDRVRFIRLWDGGDGDGPGGTAHLYREVKRRTGRVIWIDTRTLAP